MKISENVGRLKPLFLTALPYKAINYIEYVSVAFKTCILRSTDTKKKKF